MERERYGTERERQRNGEERNGNGYGTVRNGITVYQIIFDRFYFKISITITPQNRNHYSNISQIGIETLIFEEPYSLPW